MSKKKPNKTKQKKIIEPPKKKLIKMNFTEWLASQKKS